MSRQPGALSATGDLAVAMTLLMMLTIVPQARAQPRPAHELTAGGVGQTAVPERRAGPEESYRLRVQDEVKEWRRKMQVFDEKTEARSQHHIDAAETRLRRAWDETEVEARNVQTATARDWVRTKRAYEAAAHRMAMAWEKVRL